MGLENRRPLTSRSSRWAQAGAKFLVSQNVTPNHISIAAMGFAALGGASFYAAGQGFAPVVFWLLGAVCCQLRLLCNLFDGMVAIEGGRAAPDGPFWNEFPDRISDALFFLGLGYGIEAPTLAWAASAAAFLTAYVRELGANCGVAADFSGPMAKQHRMALLTGAAVLAAIGALGLFSATTIAFAALWILAIGAGATALRRALRLRHRLAARQ